jgi:hypothetical protein
MVDAQPYFSLRWMSCGHNIPLAQPEQLAEIIGEFATSVA